MVRLTDLNGVADFRLRAGGSCAGAAIRVFCDGILLATRTSVASPDQNGDLVVDEADLAILDTELGTNEPGADLDCDGVVTEADLEVARGHLGHSQATLVGARPHVPVSFRLLPPHPNPTSRGTTLAIELPSTREVTARVIDLSGRLVRVLLSDRELPAGTHTVTWDGRDARGLIVTGGAYLAHVRAGRDTGVLRIVVIR